LSRFFVVLGESNFCINNMNDFNQDLSRNKTVKLDLPSLRSKALDFHRNKQYDKAVKGYRFLLQFEPHDSSLWSNLGAALRGVKQYAAAVGCYRKALDIKPNDAGTLSNLGNVLKDMNRVEEAIVFQEQACACEPENAQYRMNYAVALREAKCFEEALTVFNQLLTEEPDNAGYQWERGLIHLYLGNFKQGWIDYEARWRTGELPVRDFHCPQWQGEPLQGKRILLVAEQGYGDTILAARFIRQVKAESPAFIGFECKPELEPVFATLEVDAFIPPKDKTYQEGEFDYYCPLMSLMGVLGIDESNIPPPVAITVPEEARAKCQKLFQFFNKKIKIGIVWSGSLTFRDNEKRATSLEQFLLLAEMPNVQLFSLQKGEREKDLQEYSALPLVYDLSKHLNTFGDTAAVIEQLDMVVMTDSSVAHLTGSMGKTIINLQQYKPYWLYYPETEGTPWYPSMKIIRQESPGDWESVFSRLLQLISKQ